MICYFAFGSNMSTRRLGARIPEAVALCVGELRAWTLLCNKTGLDGSAKANIERSATGAVWGVVTDYE